MRVQNIVAVTFLVKVKNTLNKLADSKTEEERQFGMEKRRAEQGGDGEVDGK